MATQKPISTISYNTEPFLCEVLERLYNAHIIQAYQYIFHVGEDGDKNHFHLRIEPNKRIDPMDLSVEFLEFDPQKPDKPLGVRPWRSSKEEDWILYALHDSEYLMIKYGEFEKGEKFPYEWKDIKASEWYDVETAYIRAKQSLKHNQVNMLTRLSQGESALRLVMQGENVHTVRALTSVLKMSDYERISSELNSVYSELILYQNFIRQNNLVFDFEVFCNAKN